MGRGTYSDIPKHLGAATRLIAMRLADQTYGTGSTFERLAIESVLYQKFFVITGLWSDGHKLDFDFDTSFGRRAELLLERSIVFPGQSYSMNSPILGVPIPLFRLIVTLKQVYQGAIPHRRTILAEIRNEVQSWEAVVLCNKEIDVLSDAEQPNHRHSYYKGATYLYVLIVSLLFEQSIEAQTLYDAGSRDRFDPGSKSPRIARVDSWQIQKAIQILKGYEQDDGWASCFIGNWPVYTIGFFMSRQEDVELTRRELHKRWDLTRFNQVARFINDVELTWAERKLLNRGWEPVGRCRSASQLPP